MEPKKTTKAGRFAIIGSTILASCAGPAGSPAESASVGALDLALTVEGVSVRDVSMTLTSETLTPQVIRQRTIDVIDDNATVSALEFGLAPDTYSLALRATPMDDPSTAQDESQWLCSGETTGLVIDAGETTEVDNLVLLCAADGSDLVVGGGLVVRAQVEIDRGPCDDLITSLSVAPLSVSTGASIALRATAKDGATLSWGAPVGAFDADSTTYTCPRAAGEVVLTATAVRDDGCTQTVSQAVQCQSTYTGTCDQLPEAFAFEGSCNLRSPCHVTQNGCAWEANCRGRSLVGSGEGSRFPFISGDRVCSAELTDGELVGSCENAAGEQCDFQTDQQPDPVVYCQRLPTQLPSLTACGQQWNECSVIQDGCRFQASCNGGQAVVNGRVVDDELQWNFRDEDNRYMRCQAPVIDGAVAGSCTQRGRGVTDPVTCEDFSAVIEFENLGSCEHTLDRTGFVIAGCGFDGIHFGSHRGCVWDIVGPMDANGIAAESDDFEFTTQDGRVCSAHVVDGSLQGSCAGNAESCEFATVAAAVDPACYQLPSQIDSNGCGPALSCTTKQDGCRFAALCSDGTAFTGDATNSGIRFPGLNGYSCQADLTDDGTALFGECTRENPDGSVSQCADLTATQGARLVISF